MDFRKYNKLKNALEIVTLQKKETEEELQYIESIIYELEYTKDVSEYKNCAIVAGQGEGANREIVIVNDNLSGQDRKELFVDARDIEDGTNLADRGKSKLAENTIIESF